MTAVTTFWHKDFYYTSEKENKRQYFTLLHIHFHIYTNTSIHYCAAKKITHEFALIYIYT